MHVQNSLISQTPPSLTGSGFSSAQRLDAMVGKGDTLVKHEQGAGGPSARPVALTNLASANGLRGQRDVITLTGQQVDSIAESAKRAFANPTRLTDVTPPTETPVGDRPRVALTDLLKPLAPGNPGDRPISVAPNALTDITPPGAVVGSLDSLTAVHDHDTDDQGKAISDLPRDKLADQFFDALVKTLDQSGHTGTSRTGETLADRVFSNLDRDASGAIDPQELAESLTEVHANRSNDMVGGSNLAELANETLDHSDAVSHSKNLTETDFRSRLDSMAKEIAGQLEDAGFKDHPPLNIQSLVGELSLAPAGSNMLLQMLASRFPDGLGISIFG